MRAHRAGRRSTRASRARGLSQARIDGWGRRRPPQAKSSHAKHRRESPSSRGSEVSLVTGYIRAHSDLNAVAQLLLEADRLRDTGQAAADDYSADGACHGERCEYNDRSDEVSTISLLMSSLESLIRRRLRHLGLRPLQMRRRLTGSVIHRTENSCVPCLCIPPRSDVRRAAPADASCGRSTM